MGLRVENMLLLKNPSNKICCWVRLRIVVFATLPCSVLIVEKFCDIKERIDPTTTLNKLSMNVMRSIYLSRQGESYVSQIVSGKSC